MESKKPINWIWFVIILTLQSTTWAASILFLIKHSQGLI